tara:strand:- start:1731 stop:2780 length:1050 start_codon:yes stop_codon:yes gene_type:complete
MKISIGTNIKEGPWGGGNLFAINLALYLEKNGYKVVNNLLDDDIDIILITEPRKTSESSAFTHLDVQKYIKYTKKDSLIAHRINECDERKDTKYVNKYLIEANKTSDYTIFVSQWLKDLYIQQGIGTKEKHVIYAGANKEIFNNTAFTPWDKNHKLKIVTHHWGANWNKGFETYKKIDELLDDKLWKNKIEFMYIGNLPKGFTFNNVNVVKPLSGKELSEKIKENHLYITGSIFEPSGNHHIEGAQCGLPVLYLNSGGTPEYCNGYGLVFDETNLEEKIFEMMSDYDEYVKKLRKYRFNSEKMCSDYESLFLKMFNNKEDILQSRSLDLKKSIIEKMYYQYKIKKMKNV